MFNFDTATQRGIENGFTGLSFHNDAIRTQVLVGQKYNFGILNLVHGLAFQRDTDRLIHTASGEFLGLCVDIFNRFFNRVSVVACRGGAYLLRSGIDGLTLRGA